MQRDGHRKKTATTSAAYDDSFTQKNAVFTTLVIESQTNYTGHLENFLKTEGHYILRAETAEEALAMTRRHWPDLILLNQEMDGTGGMNFLPQLLTEHPSAAVIMMADKPRPAAIVDAMRLGAMDYLERPLDTLRLKQAIDIQKELYRNL
jgi:two-component system, response regulator RegA